VLIVYFDVCCYNRPFDDSLDDRIELEANAIISIMYRCKQGNWEICSSEIVDVEVSNIKDEYKKDKVKMLVSVKDTQIKVCEDIVSRAYELQELGIKPYDSLHISCAEYGNADIFFTTDDKLIKKCKFINTRVKVCNPVTWLMEVTEDEGSY